MYFLFVLAAFVWERLWPRGASPARRPRFGGEQRAAGVAILAIAAIVALFVLQLAVENVAAENEAFRPFLARLPIRVILDQRGVPPVPAPVAYAYLACTFAQSVALAVFVAAVRATRRRRTIVVCTAIGSLALLAAALYAPAISSSDMYAYAGYGLLGKDAYRPPHTPFAGTLGAINQWYGTPIVPSAYGPLWLRLDAFVTSFGTTLVAKLWALRLFSALTFAAAIAALAIMRMPQAIVLAFALDPAIVYEYVACAHNDLVALTLIMLGIAIVRRARTAGILAAVLGASVKLPMTLPALFVALPVPQRTRRAAIVFAIILGALAVAVVDGDGPYRAALQTVALLYGAEEPPVAKVIHGIVLAIALGGAALALWSRRTWRSVAFAYASLGVTIYPWYIGWGLPYALRRPRIARDFLIVYPAAAALATTQFINTVVLDTGVVVLAVAFAVRGWDAQRSSKSR